MNTVNIAINDQSLKHETSVNYLGIMMAQFEDLKENKAIQPNDERIAMRLPKMFASWYKEVWWKVWSAECGVLRKKWKMRSAEYCPRSGK